MRGVRSGPVTITAISMQAVGLGIEPGHFAVEPDQVLVGFGKGRQGHGWGLRHARDCRRWPKLEPDDCPLYTLTLAFAAFLVAGLWP